MNKKLLLSFFLITIQNCVCTHSNYTTPLVLSTITRSQTKDTGAVIAAGGDSGSSKCPDCNCDCPNPCADPCPNPCPDVVTYTCPDPCQGGGSGFVDFTTLVVDDYKTTGTLLFDPGKYKLDGTLIYTGTFSPITIGASNITIDCNGNSISYAGVTADVPGITVRKGLKNITLVNCKINSFTDAGVQAPGTSDDNIEQLTLYNMTLFNNKHGFYGTYITLLDISYSNALKNSAGAAITYGFYINNSSVVTLTNSIASSNTSTHSTAGFYISNSASCSLKKCNALSNTGTLDSYGIYVSTLTGINSITECSTNFNVSTANTGYGIYSASNARIFIKESESNLNSHIGIYLTNTANSVLSKNIADNNLFGFYDETDKGSNIFLSNSATNNTTANFYRPNFAPIQFIAVNADNLQQATAAGPLDNIAVQLTS